MTSYPKISIVTPSFNQAEFLEETICSILDQGYPNLEYIIIDGGSTDGSVEIIKKYAKHLSYWISKKDTGHGNALNKGFAKTTGDIMAWLNSDDKYFSGALFDVAEIFNSYQDVNWITGKTCVWNEAGNLTYEAYVYKNIFDFLVNNYKWIQQETTFWRRSLWEKAGGYINENYKLMVDGELWTRFFLYDELWHVNKKLGGYRLHTTNRAHLYREKVIAEMEAAIAVMKDRVKEREELLNLCNKISNLSVYTDNSDCLDYNVIDTTDKGWIKKKVNYYAIKLAEENNHFIKYIEQQLSDLTQGFVHNNTYSSINYLYKEWMDVLLVNNQGISSSLYKEGIHRVAVFGTKNNALYLYYDLTKERIEVVSFIDNAPNMQNEKIKSINVVPSDWLIEHQNDIDAVILSIEGEHDLKIKEQLRLLVGNRIPIISWKDIIIKNRYLMDKE